MLSQPALYRFLTQSAQNYPERPAVIEPGCNVLSFSDLNRLSDLLRDRLCYLGVQPGDRVGIYLRKSTDSVASIFGVLKSGAAYVPVDAYGPPSRGGYILADCSVRAVIVERQYVDRLKSEFLAAGVNPDLLILESTGGGKGLRDLLQKLQDIEPAPEVTIPTPSPSDLAYILYTSGSTGKPKGVMLTHEAAISFVDWCSEIFQPVPEDRFSSHAPFHFDLSILDLYVPIKHAASVVLIDESTGKDPQKLADLIESERITSWYSTPSILTLLTQYGKLERFNYSKLRTILFAGEVFPVKHLRTLTSAVPHPRYFNLYGPTETNVCTFFEIPPTIPPEQTQPFPIGKACSHLETIVVDEEGNPGLPGEEGELFVRGPGVMAGYWNLAERTENAFLLDANGSHWYKTGDIVFEDSTGNYIFVGRRDRMVKKRGYRIELGEIEAGLYRHPAIAEAAVVAIMDKDDGVRIKAFLSCHDHDQPSIIELKQFCATSLPSYMAPDIFSFHSRLPKTSTDKIDYQKLMSM